MLEFQRYQLEFTAHIRNPKTSKKPALVDEARMAVYTDIVFNNILNSVTTCFPVCAQVLGELAWQNLVREFFAKYQATSPIFREIPQQFLQFLTLIDYLPAYFQQLAHYEWVELSVNTQEITLFNWPHPLLNISKTSDLLNKRPVLAPAHMLLEYDYAVHKISKRNQLTATEKTYLLVFRNSEFKVKFIELNPTTYLLLRLIKESNMSGKQALVQLAADIKHPDTEAVIQFGVEILSDLAKQEAIIGREFI